jgi:hypothetical protein
MIAFVRWSFATVYSLLNYLTPINVMCRNVTLKRYHLKSFRGVQSSAAASSDRLSANGFQAMQNS